MILSALIKVLNMLISFALALFPTYEPPHDSPQWSALSAANIVLPLDTWAMLSGATIAIMGCTLLIWAVMKVFNMVRGAGA